MHLRTHGPGSERDFVARLHTDGVFDSVDTVRLESADKFAVTDGGHTPSCSTSTPTTGPMG